jgi:hypothetical protein
MSADASTRDLLGAPVPEEVHSVSPPAHWLKVSEVAGRVLVVPLAPADSGDTKKCRPIGCYDAAEQLARRYREDR